MKPIGLDSAQQRSGNGNLIFFSEISTDAFLHVVLLRNWRGKLLAAKGSALISHMAMELHDCMHCIRMHKQPDWLRSEASGRDVHQGRSDLPNRSCELERHDGKRHSCTCSMSLLVHKSKTLSAYSMSG